MPLKKLFTLKMLELDSFSLYNATAFSVVTPPRILLNVTVFCDTFSYIENKSCH